MNPHLRSLRDKLFRELAQAEYDADVHTTREAHRLGDVLPAERFLAIAAHAKQLRPRFDALTLHRQPVGIRFARVVGEVFSDARHFVVDRVLATERSYRATLLGLRHGLDAAKLLREVARTAEHVRLQQFCDQLIEGREPLVERATAALGWFAANPAIANISGFRIALKRAPRLSSQRSGALASVTE